VTLNNLTIINLCHQIDLIPLSWFLAFKHLSINLSLISLEGIEVPKLAEGGCAWVVIKNPWLLFTKNQKFIQSFLLDQRLRIAWANWGGKPIIYLYDLIIAFNRVSPVRINHLKYYFFLLNLLLATFNKE
jgi:hypothetical protein